MRTGIAAVSLYALLLAHATAQAGAAKPEKTWMDLAVGVDLRWSAEGKASGKMGRGTTSGGGGVHELRFACLGSDAEGRLRLAILDEQLPEESFDVPIVNCEFALLDPRTGELVPEAADAAADRWSTVHSFPYPALSPAQWKAKKPLSMPTRTWIAGEPQTVPASIAFETRKAGKKTTTVLVATTDPKSPVAIKMVGIAGMVAMASGRMPALGASGVQPVDVKVTELRQEFEFGDNGRLVAIRTQSKLDAADGKLVLTGEDTAREIERRVLKPAELTPFAAAIAEIGAIAQSKDGREARAERAKKLQPDAAKVGLGPTVERLIKNLTMDGLPPGIPR